MCKETRFLILSISLILASLAFASDQCPITLLSATGDAGSIAITFQATGKLPIRQLEFNCVPAQQQTRAARYTHCREANALFFPGTEYTVSYPYPRGRRERIRVSLKSATLSNGYVWTPSKRQVCSVLRIVPKKK